MPSVNWERAIEPLLKKYKHKKHPLEYRDLYQLIVMVILSAQSTDTYINQFAAGFFAKFPDFTSLAQADEETVFRETAHVRNGRNKARWLIQTAAILRSEKHIPKTLEALTKLPGIGRKSANVIMREAGYPAEGIAVDLHVARVAPRLGMVHTEDRDKIEKEMMRKLPQKQWGDAGLALSFLGREICRPRNPKCAECVMNGVCAYYKKSGGGTR